MKYREIIFNYEGSRQKQKDFLKFHLFWKDGVGLKVMLYFLMLLAAGGFCLFYRRYFIGAGLLIVALFIIGYFIVANRAVIRNNLVSENSFPPLRVILDDKNITLTNCLTGETVVKDLRHVDIVYRRRRSIYIYMSAHHALCLRDNELISGDIHKYFTGNPLLRSKYKSPKPKRIR